MGGSQSLTDKDIVSLLYLYRQEPSRSLSSYRENLNQLTGSDVSCSTISHFKIMLAPSKVPYAIEKFRPVETGLPENNGCVTVARLISS